MAVTRYKISVLDYKDCKLKMPARTLKEYLQAWRNNYCTSSMCTMCKRKLSFNYENEPCNFTICCNNFYFKPTKLYLVQSIAVKTPNIAFLPNALAKHIHKDSQDFLIFPDPQYWLISSTLTFDRILNFALGLPLSKRTETKIKSSSYYLQQMQTVPLNHGSLEQRAQGKNTYFRKIALAKRAELTLRAMIIPAPFLKPNEIVIPDKMDKALHLKGKWIIINRMPSLIPENFVGLKITSTWPHDCFGIPLEIVQEMNADFDGDEINAYVITNIQSQAECATLLNSYYNMSSFTMGTKLTPCHDMLVTYYLKYNDIHFLPYKHLDLKKTFRVLYDLYGSEKCFDYIDQLREYYLKVMQDDMLYALTLEEFNVLESFAKNTSFEEFAEKAKNFKSCLTIQILSGAKGTFYHLYQLVGSVGLQYTQHIEPITDPNIKSSFLKGLEPMELVVHAQAGFDAFINASSVWVPGYNFFKLANNLQDLSVNYKGQLVDKQSVLADDVLTAMHYEDLLSKQSFEALIDKYLIQLKN